MAWQTPKTNWTPSDAPTSSDFNKIEGNINYIEEESRTPSQTETPVASGKLSVLLNYIATMIKSITGKTNWYNTPDTTLAAAKSHMDASAPHSGHETPSGAQAKVNTHANTHIGHGYYGAASGAANAYSVTLSPAPSGYVAGMFVAVKINVTNTGSSTINVNGLGAKTIKKPNGSNVSSGNLVINSVYSLRYNGTNFILQGEGSEGNAVAGDVLSGKTFSNSTQIGLTGTMPDRSGNTAALSSAISGNTLRLRASHGYRDGTNDFVTIADNDWIESNIRSGVNLFGKVGTLTPMPPNIVNVFHPDTSGLLLNQMWSYVWGSGGAFIEWGDRFLKMTMDDDERYRIVSHAPINFDYIKGFILDLTSPITPKFTVSLYRSSSSGTIVGSAIIPPTSLESIDRGVMVDVSGNPDCTGIHYMRLSFTNSDLSTSTAYFRGLTIIYDL